ncbi:MAG: hypothetical protein Q9P01_05780 [Anaerolineae bacterium]|nr:hypothetical protein [Anaerolineae bacterium]
MTSLKGSVETFMITTFMPFIESMTPFVERTIGIVNAITAWIGANQAIVQPILRVLALLIAMGPTLFIVGKAISFVGFLIGALVNPLQLGMLAVMAFSAAWTANFMGIRDRLQPIINGITHVLGNFVADIRQFGLQEAFLGIFGKGSLGETMQSSLEGALTMMGVSRDRAISIVNSIWFAISPLVNIVSTVFRAFSDGFRAFRTTLSSGMGIFISLDFAIQTFFGSLGVGAASISRVRSAILGMIDVLSQIWGFIQPVVVIFAEWIASILGVNAVVGAMAGIFGAIASVIAPIIGLIGGVIAALISPIGLAIGLLGFCFANAYIGKLHGYPRFY